MTSNTPVPPIALPGQPLATLSSYKPGPGTHLPPSAIPSSSPSSIIHASILGPTVTTPAKKGLPSLSISRQETITQQTQTTLLPKEGSIVLGRVTRINIREARVQILVINDTPTMEEFTGVIRYSIYVSVYEYRVQDVRATEKDRVKIYSSFRPGDIVRAEVVTLVQELTLITRFHWEINNRII
jgi:exosome complex component CSL4